MNALRALPKDKLQKVLLVAIVMLIALAAVGNFYIGRQLSSISQSNDQIAKLKRQIDDAEREAKQEVENQHLHEQVVAFVQSQTDTMVSGDPFSWVVRQITLFAEKRPVHVLSMRPGTTSQSQQKSRFNIYSAHIEVEGGYDQIGQFVRDFENAFPTSQIRSLDLGEGSTGQADRHAALELAFTVQPDSVSQKPKATAKVEGKKA